jgi:hypothetical protein
MINLNNMSSKRKIIFISFFVLVALLLLFIYLYSKTPKKFITPLQIPTEIATGDYKIEQEFTEKDFNFPKSLPLLTVKPTTELSDEESKSLGSKLGFLDEPQIINDYFEGKLFFWHKQEGDLTIYPKARMVIYTSDSALSKSTQGRTLSEGEIIKKATDFLTQNSFFDPNQIKFTTINYLKKDSHTDITTKDKAEMYLLNFAPKIAAYSILSLDPINSNVSVYVTKSGLITRAKIVLLGEMLESKETYTLKNYIEVVSSLHQAKIVSLEDGNITSVDSSITPIQSVKVKSIELAYFIDESNPAIYPVFLIKGIADLKNMGELSAFLYLPAISQSQAP